MKFVFTVIMFLCWSVPSVVKSTEYKIANDYRELSNFVDFKIFLFTYICENELKINAEILKLRQDFISNPLFSSITASSITCLDLRNNRIENIETGAFNKLTNLTQLFLSGNRLRTSQLFNFGSHDQLQVLVMNRAVGDSYRENIQISSEYPNLEILSLRNNLIQDLYFLPKKNPFESSFTQTIMSETPFPKLQILDLSENALRDGQMNFINLLPNSLYFLDLHGNALTYLNLNFIINKLSAVNLDDNQFMYINNCAHYSHCLSVTGLKDLNYLSVSANSIQNIEVNAFQDNNNLVYLNLSRNNINNLYPETFANLQYLKTLDLSGNKLQDVPQISNEIGITTLYINHNNIMELLPYTFVQMPNLTKLLLGENKINKTDINAFANLSVLEELDLSRNMLSAFPEGWTESLVSLKYLDLSNNRFTSLESLSLTNTLPLIEIYLMMNSLEYLNIRYLESLPQNLTMINLINKSNFSNWMQMENNY
ncbi:PREDICTED: podocan-like [Vollenhovia emeryi]|uniref:podocan-like n=1 Tax=Vollenhovia emeryi TaxID=411798 RepID=UPI0005F52F22|nr:PREDICTED: podocan-like [Vollenhovia emeryi]